MELEHIVLIPSSRTISLRCRNSKGSPNLTSFSFDELAAGDSSVVNDLISSLSVRIPKEPSEAVLSEIASLETRLQDLRKQAGIS